MNYFKTLKKNLLWFLFALILMDSSPLYAGAWVQPNGKMYNQISLERFVSTETYNDDTQFAPRDDNSTWTTHGVSWYQEYGFHDKWTVFSSVPYQQVSLKNSDLIVSQTTSGFADIEIGVKYSLLASPIVISVQPSIKVPGGYDPEHYPPLGDGNMDAETRLLFGASLYPTIPGYAGFELAYRLRDGTPRDEYRSLVEFGFNVTQKFGVRMKLNLAQSTSLEDSDPASDEGPAIEWRQLFMTGSYEIEPNKWVELTWAPYIYGRNTAAGTSVFLGFAWKSF